ncbi:MAG: hypothetical protein ACO3NK_16665 [Prochlorotrichaceae cyanobacterium]|jgi:hypothetical protein
MFHLSPDAELLKLLLDSDQENLTPYIWDPFSPETEAYIQSLEQAWPADIVADYAAIVPSFQKALNLVPEQLVSESQAASLQNFFSGVPQPVLQHILAKAKTASLEVLALPEQLLECVQELFPRWSVEDLQVVARPYAYAFRNSEQGSLTAPPETIEWDQLSDLEQIRLCFQVSKAILTDLNSEA